MWWIVSSMLLFLWLVGIALERVFTRYLKIQGKLEKQERFTLIGQMTAVLTHEIRNALGGVKGFSQWIAEKMDDKDERKSAVLAVIKGTQRIESLVNDLLLFSRDEVYNISNVILQPIAQEVLQSFSLSWKGKYEVDIDSDCRILADSVKLYRVLLNGVKNSIEAMGDGGLLKMSATLNRRKVIITISDTGKGVSKNDMQRIFTPFFTTKINGTGLGLAYSRKVIEGMGGTIELCNKTDGLGAELRISLPGGK
jgi:signal transduction histidine kinase